MNRGIELLIARMKSNPDEFAPDSYMREDSSSKWEQLVYNWRHCLTEEELKAFQDALKKAHRELFSQRVMKHILTAGEVHDVVDAVQSPYQHPYNTPIVTLQPNTASAFTANSLHVGDETLDAETLRLMKEQLKQYKATGKI